MWKVIKPILGQLLGSKKFLATLAAVIVWVVGKFGADIDDATLLPIIGAIAAYVLAQGWADTGKEAAKIAAPIEAAKLEAAKEAAGKAPAA